MGIVFLVLAVAFNSAGNFFLKLGADRGFSFSIKNGIFEFFQDNVFLITGVFLFAVNVVFYTLALRMLPLAVAYPVMPGATFILVGSLASVFFNESVSLWHILGYTLIVLGVTVVSVASSAS